GAWSKPPGKPLFGPVEIGGISELLEQRISLGCRDVHSSRAKNGRFVGGWRPRPKFICRLERAKSKGLRRLYADKPGAIDRLAQCVGAPRQRVSDRQNGR